MRILHTPVRFYPYTGGVENYVLELGRRLTDRGHEVAVMCADEPHASELSVEGVSVRRLGYLGKVANTNVTPMLPLRLLRERFDILHTHLPTPWSADWSAIVSWMRKKPLVLTYHNDIVGSGFADRIARLYNRTALGLVLRRAERIIVTRQEYLDHSPHLAPYEDKVEVIPVGVDTERFTPAKAADDDGPTIFFLAILDDFHHYKGLDVLLEAMKLVQGELPGARLVVGGSGSLLEHYRDRARALGVEDVEFAGFIPDDELPDVYRRASVFVLPSLSADQEGFGIVALEALACGTPVITTDVVGIAPELEREDAGAVVRPGRAEELARAIIELLQDEARRTEMGRAGRLLAERYGWDAIAGRIEQLYAEVLGR